MKCPQRPEKGIGSSGSGVTDSRGCWELNLGPLEEQGAFLTAEPSLQLLEAFLNEAGWGRGDPFACIWMEGLRKVCWKILPLEQ